MAPIDENDVKSTEDAFGELNAQKTSKPDVSASTPAPVAPPETAAVEERPDVKLAFDADNFEKPKEDHVLISVAGIEPTKLPTSGTITVSHEEAAQLVSLPAVKVVE